MLKTGGREVEGRKPDEIEDLELFNERAAIREFCGGMTRADAEVAAAEDVKRWRETWGK